MRFVYTSDRNMNTNVQIYEANQFSASQEIPLI